MVSTPEWPLLTKRSVYERLSKYIIADGLLSNRVPARNAIGYDDPDWNLRQWDYHNISVFGRSQSGFGPRIYLCLWTKFRRHSRQYDNAVDGNRILGDISMKKLALFLALMGLAATL
ncbi:MAG: hypothetical protein KGJ13_02265, partial [Patescibacteria group bacterium]|nr:hypothetical protein [Patescibacteria group bacterium]